MISKKYRFSGQNDLRILFRKSYSVRGQLFTIRYRQSRHHNNFRAAVVVSKKITKSAPKRNRIRRRIYELLRLEGPKYLTNQDLAVIVYSDKVAEIPHDELKNILTDQLKQIKKQRN